MRSGTGPASSGCRSTKDYLRNIIVKLNIFYVFQRGILRVGWPFARGAGFNKFVD